MTVEAADDEWGEGTGTMAVRRARGEGALVGDDAQVDAPVGVVRDGRYDMAPRGIDGMRAVDQTVARSKPTITPWMVRSTAGSRSG